MCHFACTIDSAELERDLVPISGMLPGFKVEYKVHRYFSYAQFMRRSFEGNSTFLLRGFLGVLLHIWLGHDFF